MIDRRDDTRILVVDDDPVFISRTQQALEPIAFIRTAVTGGEALTFALRWRPSVVLFDLLLHDLDGFAFIDELAASGIDPHPFILYTTGGRGSGTRVLPLPDWRVGTLLRSSTEYQLRAAVMKAVRAQHLTDQGRLTV